MQQDCVKSYLSGLGFGIKDGEVDASLAMRNGTAVDNRTTSHQCVHPFVPGKFFLDLA
jgi:hypothetical protein